MMRLVFADLVRSIRVWMGVFVVTVTAGFVGALAASMIETSWHVTEQLRQFLAGASSAVLMFTSVTALIVISSVSHLTVALQRRDYALWQLVGVRPSAVSGIVVTQLAVVGTLGSAFGTVVALTVLNPMLHLIFRGWDRLDSVNFVLAPIAMVCVIGAVLVIVLLGGLRGARNAGRVAPITALRESEAVSDRVRWFRMLLAAAVLVVLIWVSISLYEAEFTYILNTSIAITPLILVLLAVLGPLVFPVVLRVWTALLPHRLSASWYLSRHSAEYRLSQSAAAISPLMVAIGLTGGLYTASSLLRQSLIERTGEDHGWSLPLESVVVMLGGPLLLSGVAAAAIVYMTSHAREREFALVLAAGATRGHVTLMSVWEALIYAGTALLLGILAIVGGGVIVATALGLHSMPVSWVSTLFIAGGGLVLLLAATVVPTVVGLRHSVSRTLAVV